MYICGICQISMSDNEGIMWRRSAYHDGSLGIEDPQTDIEYIGKTEYGMGGCFHRNGSDIGKGRDCGK